MRIRAADAIAIVAVLGGATARGLWSFWLHPPPDYVYSDMATYVASAAKLALRTDIGPAVAFQPQGVHLLLALPLWLFDFTRKGLWVGAGIWWVLSAATPFFAWQLARLTLGATAGAVTAVLTALSPLYVTDAGYFLSETPALAFLLVALWLVYRAERTDGRAALWQGLVAGVFGAAAVATRPQFLLNVVLVALPLLPRRRRSRTAVAAYVGGATLVLAAVIGLNSSINGRLTGFAREGGVTFYLGECHIRHVHVQGPASTYEIAPPPYVQSGEGGTAAFTGHDVWDEGFFYRKGFACIRRQGAHYPVHALRMLADATATSTPWPQADEATLSRVADVYNTVYSYGFLPLILVVAVARIGRRVRTAAGETAMLAHFACMIPIAIVFIGDPRVRSSYDVFIFALAGAAIASVLERQQPARVVSGAAETGGRRLTVTSPCSRQLLPDGDIAIPDC